MVAKNMVYSEPSLVRAVKGAVELNGPDDVDVVMTPEAAEETSERLTNEAVKARGQRRLGSLTHRPMD
jgi:glutamine synthetase adenylyltransferase